MAPTDETRPLPPTTGVQVVQEPKLHNVFKISINNDDSENREREAILKKDTENTKDAIKQILFPIIFSGFGNMGAGIILSSVVSWPVFKKIPQLIILVPALLGLKGNVEMTLSSRLGTSAHLGHLEDKKKRKQIVIGSIALAQCQASTVGLITPLIAIGFSYLQGGPSSAEPNGEDYSLNITKILLIMACSVITSGFADLILSSTMCAIVLVSQIVFKINSDNISTPLAASIGDLATMGFLALTSRMLYNAYLSFEWVPLFPILFWCLVIAITATIARRNEYTKKIVLNGWTPLIISMLIQNTSGAIMENFITEFQTMAAFQPVINGFGGNLVAVQSSRIASYLHKTTKKKQLPESDPRICISPWNLFFGSSPHGRLALMLVLMAAPLQLPLIFLIRFITHNAILTSPLVITYYICCTVQVAIMLYIGYCFVHFLWRFGFNPDNSAIPILTALADLLGSIFLALGFLFLRSIEDPNALYPSDEAITILTTTVGSAVNATLTTIATHVPAF